MKATAVAAMADGISFSFRMHWQSGSRRHRRQPCHTCTNVNNDSTHLRTSAGRRVDGLPGAMPGVGIDEYGISLMAATP